MKTTLNEFKAKALADPTVAKEYEKLSSAYALRRKLIRIRKDAGFTQEELAEILHTKKSNISRLENVNTQTSPKLSTIERYAEAVGYELEISFVPHGH
ncbi:MAG: helix-turn-helix transcriptional regulator [Thermodesulfobacteriota bacterium]|nr:helix-turn-helix transcriptional regulator [Thermodesulfobacteriota bacterium]